MVTIPNELGDYIVDFLHNDRCSLKACSLACRSLYPAARYHLYNRVCLSSPQACRVLEEQLNISPYLGQFTQYLNMAKVIPHPPSADSKEHDLHAMPRSWSTLFSMMPNVQQFELSLLEVDIHFHSALLQNFTRTTELTLQYCRFPSFGDLSSALLSFPLLQRCTLRGVSWESEPQLFFGGPTEKRAAPICLKSLTLGRDLDLQVLIEWMLQYHVCDELESIAACLAYEGDAIMLGELVRASAPTLKHIELDWYSSSYRDIRLPFGFTLAGCSNLQTLSLHCPVALESTVSWVNALLTDVGSEKLEKVTLDVRLLGSLFALNWAHMERLLLRDTFKALKEVGVKVAVWHTSPDHTQDVTSFVRRHLPHLHSRSILQCGS